MDKKKEQGTVQVGEIVGTVKIEDKSWDHLFPPSQDLAFATFMMLWYILERYKI